MATAADFTSDETIDSFEIGDCTIDLIGYVISSSNNFHTPNQGKFQKFVVSNDSSKKVQVIAWNDCIRKVDEVKETGSIVHFGSLKCSNVKIADYNSGNVFY